jgi:predicted SprT family Zn-dependent metalloprotease
VGSRGILTEKIIDAHYLGTALLREHGLDDWKFVLDNSKRRVGECRYHKREIGLSIWFLEKSSEAEIEDTIKHEIAHALVGPDVKSHGDEWKAKAVEVGAKPRALAGEEAVSSAKPNYVMRCPSCGREWPRYRMRRRNFGAKCPNCNVEVKIFKYVRK